MMTWVAAALTVLAGVLTLFVLGLLRAQGDLMRRVSELERSSRTLSPGVVPRPDTIAQPTVAAIAGVDAALEPYSLEVGAVPASYLLVAFLSTSCLTCLDIWRDIIDAGDGATEVVAGDDVAS